MNLRNLLIGVVAVSAVAGVANAATTISQSAAANATIVQPATLSATRSLEFGTVALPTVGSSVITVASVSSSTQTPTIANTSGGNAYLVQQGAARAAQFHVSGTSGDTFQVSTATLTLSGPGAITATVGTPTPTTSAVSGSTYTLPAGGTDDIFVGGSITLTPTTAAGTYSGTVALTLAYN